MSGPKIPSTRPASKPSAPEPPLQLGDIVAAGHRRAEVELSLAEPIARFDQRLPGGRTDPLVGVEPGGALEGRECGDRARPEGARSVGATRVAQRIEPLLEIVDGRRRHHRAPGAARSLRTSPGPPASGTRWQLAPPACSARPPPTGPTAAFGRSARRTAQRLRTWSIRRQ